MYRLAVDPQRRRLGLARKLVEEVETHLRQAGAERITSLVFKEEGPVAFWKSVGYNLDHATDSYAKICYEPLGKSVLVQVLSL